MTNEQEKQLERTTYVLGLLISWLPQAAGSPLSRSDAKMLLDKLHSKQALKDTQP